MKTTLITAAIALLIGLGLGSQLFPRAAVETKEVEKVVTVKDVVTVTKVVSKNDGTTETTTTTTDKSKESKRASNTVKVNKKEWHGSLLASTNSINMDNIVYTVNVERRIIGELFVGASVSTDKRVGVSLGMGF